MQKSTLTFSLFVKLSAHQPLSVALRITMNKDDFAAFIFVDNLRFS